MLITASRVDLQFGCNMFATLPLEAFVCREVLENYYWPEQQYMPKRHVIITSSLVLGSLLSMFVTAEFPAQG